MLRIAFGVGLGLLLVCGIAVGAEPLKLDTEKSKIEFVGKKTDGEHAGGFKTFTVDAAADFEEPAKSKLSIEIDASSLWSDDEKLTNHLKNPDFFDVRKHPKITFDATEIVPQGETKGTIKGNLTMLGETAAIEIPADVKVTDEAVELKASFKIDRTKWGMNYGSGKIDDDVEVTATLVMLR